MVHRHTLEDEVKAARDEARQGTISIEESRMLRVENEKLIADLASLREKLSMVGGEHWLPPARLLDI